MSPWIQYTLARLGIFVVTFLVLLLVGTGWLLSAIFAALISLALSVLFLGNLRAVVAKELERRIRKPEKDRDSAVEDDQLDSTKP
jgi:cytochrome c-type biogenesis protein CcmH/NrfG